MTHASRPKMATKALLLSVMGVFLWVLQAEAASISTRVRILENKVGKAEQSARLAARKAAAVEKTLKAQSTQLDQLVVDVQKIQRYLEEDRSKAKGKGQDKRYAFP